jgi:hypothetical protein
VGNGEKSSILGQYCFELVCGDDVGGHLAKRTFEWLMSVDFGDFVKLAGFPTKGEGQDSSFVNWKDLLMAT